MDAECESGNCGSTSFHVGDDGFTYCSEGHRQLSRGTQVADDNDGLPQFGRKARRRGEEEEAADTALSGKRAFEHYLLCFQLILWKQVHWLIHVKEFPPELETIVRDLWALRLQTLQSRANYDSESEAEQSSQMYSSQSEADYTDASTRRKTRKSKTDSIPQLVDALSICYIGTSLLRLPLTVNDLYVWVASGELLYYRAVRTLSASMKQRLPFNYNQTLDPQVILKPSMLHKAVLENVNAYQQGFGMVIPPINHILVLYRWVESLALPLETYAAVLRLAKILNIEFSYESNEQRRPSRLRVLRVPETRLMALLVVATKLLFPMDGAKRYPRKPTELSALTMDWSAWCVAKDEYEQSTKQTDRLGHENALRVSESDVLEMTNDKLDEYMDWYASSLASEDVKEKGRAGREVEFRRAMFRFFPIDRPTDRSENTGGEELEERSLGLRGSRIKHVQHAMRPVGVKRDSDAPDDKATQRPGSNYKRFRNVNELSGHAERFYTEAAKLSGISLDSLVQGVFSIERRLQELEEHTRKMDDQNV